MQSLNHLDLRTLKAKATPEVWQEVPRQVFATWSTARQLDYCLRRDLASANDPKCYEGNMGKEWFLARAEGYKVSLNEELKRMGFKERP